MVKIDIDLEEATVGDIERTFEQLGTTYVDRLGDTTDACFSTPLTGLLQVLLEQVRRKTKQSRPDWWAQLSMLSPLQSLFEAEVRGLVDGMWAATSRIHGVSRDEARHRYNIRPFRADDWDGLRESQYTYDWSTDGDQTAFKMEPIDRFEVAGIYGWMTGNCGSTVRHLEVWANHRKVREWCGAQLSPDLNGLSIFFDPFFAKKPDNLRVVPCTTAASQYAKAFPIGLVIEKKDEEDISGCERWGSRGSDGIQEQ